MVLNGIQLQRIDWIYPQKKVHGLPKASSFDTPWTFYNAMLNEFYTSV